MKRVGSLSRRIFSALGAPGVLAAAATGSLAIAASFPIPAQGTTIGGGGAPNDPTWWEAHPGISRFLEPADTFFVALIPAWIAYVAMLALLSSRLSWSRRDRWQTFLHSAATGMALFVFLPFVYRQLYPIFVDHANTAPPAVLWPVFTAVARVDAALALFVLWFSLQPQTLGFLRRKKKAEPGRPPVTWPATLFASAFFLLALLGMFYLTVIVVQGSGLFE